MQLPRIAACALILMGVTSESAEAATTKVCDMSQLNSAVSAARPGDTIQMCDGTWRNAKVLFQVRGTSSNPIRLEAETPGKVILTGSSQLFIAGKFAIVDGLTFTGTYTGSDYRVIQFQNGTSGSCIDCRLTNTSVLEYNPSDSTRNTKWVVIQGERNRVDHNHFRGKTNLGAMVQVNIQANAGPNYHRIDHNFLEKRPFFRSEQSQNADTLEIGSVSKYAYRESRTTVEYNYLLDIDSDYEVVTVKSSGNTLRHNVLDSSAGVFSLRQGTNNTVDGNYIFGRNDAESGGIRVTGDGHRILNNYISGVSPLGTDSLAPISLSTGSTETITAGNDAPPYYHYEVAQNVVVAHNTVVNSGDAILLGLGNHGVSPRNIDIRANVLYRIDGACAKEKRAGANIRFSDNICGGGTNSPNQSGIADRDPGLNVDSRGVFRPTASSAVINATSSSVFSGMTDMDGQARSTPYDIGADEYLPGKQGRGPISICDVGPVTYRNGGSCGGKSPPKAPTALLVQ